MISTSRLFFALDVVTLLKDNAELHLNEEERAEALREEIDSERDRRPNAAAPGVSTAPIAIGAGEVAASLGAGMVAAAAAALIGAGDSSAGVDSVLVDKGEGVDMLP